MRKNPADLHPKSDKASLNLGGQETAKFCMNVIFEMFGDGKVVTPRTLNAEFEIRKHASNDNIEIGAYKAGIESLNRVLSKNLSALMKKLKSD